ncbi:MAG: amidohydrolase family protein [Bacteroidota bacterium]|nr:amidohydrolase family protein [Bacteroidota bacterium]
MKNLLKFKNLCLFVLCVFIQNCGQTKKGSSGVENSKSGFYTADDFKTVEKYDTHVHINVDDTTFIQQAKEDNFHLLTVNVNASDVASAIEEQRSVALRLIKAYPGRLAYATTFNLKDWGSDKWQPQTLAYLKESFEKGAIAVKIWKNIGMELRDKDGKFVMIDDSRFDPVLDFIEKNHLTLIGHFGEPKNCWLPVEQMTVAGDKRYFSQHPQYHMYLHPEYPSYEDQINAQDNMLQKHQNLRFVGAHLGSLEWNVDELAKRLDKFPNMAVDMAARICHLQFQSMKNWQKVHDFMIKYQDRLLYATDQVVAKDSDFGELKKSMHGTRVSDWKFFVTNEEMSVSDFDGRFRGLKLPKEVIDKIYRKNAKKWFPGI